MYTDERIKTLDEDYALVSRSLIDECQSILSNSGNPDVRLLGERLKAALDGSIASVAEEQRQMYLRLRDHYARTGITWALPAGIEP